MRGCTDDQSTEIYAASRSIAASATPPGPRLPLSISRKELGVLGLALVVVENDKAGSAIAEAEVSTSRASHADRVHCSKYRLRCG